MTGRKRYGTVSYFDVPAELVGSRRWDQPGPERDKEIAALACDGWTYEAIGLVYDLSRGRVWQIVRRGRA